MSKLTGRTQDCGASQARTRLSQARKFLDVAELVASEDYEESFSVAAALAVLAGIAASDAACCKALGRRPRGENHRDAAALLDQVIPDGKKAGRWLNGLIDLKDTAHCGLIYVTRPQLKSAIRKAAQLVEFADDVIRR
jgi:hypothetical protein